MNIKNYIDDNYRLNFLLQGYMGIKYTINKLKMEVTNNGN